MNLAHQQAEEAPARRLSRAQQTAVMRMVDAPLAWPRAAQSRPRRLRAMATTIGILLALALLAIAYAMLIPR